MIYEDIFSVPIIQIIQSEFLEEHINAPSPVRGKFRCRVGVGQ